MKLIFISGAPGVGKTFFSRRLSKKLNIGQIVSTDNIREIMRAFKSKEESPILHNSAIKAVFDDYEPDLKEISGFIEQSKVLQEGINAIVERAKKEQEDIIIEGIHLIPNLIEIDKTIEFMHFVVTAENQEKHIQKLGTSQGINRSSYKIENINRAWQYQEYLIEKAKGSDIKIVENNYTIEKIDNAIIEILKKQKKKILVIDTMGVLFPNVVDGSRIKLTDLYNRLTEPRVDYETFYSKYKELIIGQISIERFWQDISSDKDDRSQIEKEHLDTYEIHTDIKNIVNKLKEDYIIVTLTNHPRKWMDYIAQKFNLHEILDYIYLSEDFKDEKPSQALYQRILELHNVVATEAILVDDQSKNLISASQIGMITVKCNTTKEDNAFIPNYEINDFSEITDIIDSKVL